MPTATVPMKKVTRAMVGLQALHLSNSFCCFSVSTSVVLKSFFPWCLMLGDNMDTIATHLREVHYWLAIACDVCKAFANMSAQIVLEHCFRLSGQAAKKEVQGKKVGKSFLKLTLPNPAEWRMPKTFHPILVINVGWSSCLDLVFQMSLCSVIQTVIFLFC